MMTVFSPSPLVLEACESLKKSLYHFLLMLYLPDVRSEAKKCIPDSHRAIELLLREYSITELGDTPENVRQTNTYELIDRFDWDSLNNERALKLLNNWRNQYIHGVIEDFDDFDECEIQEIFQQCLFAAGQLLEKLGYTIDRFFFPLDQSLLIKEKPEWQDLASKIAHIALHDFPRDPDITIDLANAAFMIAFINFAKSWEFSIHNSLSSESNDTIEVKNLVKALVKEMNDHEEEDARFWWWNNSDPAITNNYRDLNSFWFVPPMTMNNLLSAKLKRDLDPVEAGRYYVAEVNEMVKCFIDRSPMLTLERFVKSNWQKITIELKKSCPEIEIPVLDFEEWTRQHFTNKTITIWIDPGFTCVNWSEIEKKMFLETVENFYGKLPNGINVIIQKGMQA